MDESISKYMAEIGRKGGKKSRRILTREQSLAMIKARKEKQASKPDESSKLNF